MRTRVCVCWRARAHPIIFPGPSKTNGCWPPSAADEGRQTLREAISEGHARSRTVCERVRVNAGVARDERDATPAGPSRHVRKEDGDFSQRRNEEGR